MADLFLLKTPQVYTSPRAALILYHLLLNPGATVVVQPFTFGKVKHSFQKLPDWMKEAFKRNEETS